MVLARLEEVVQQKIGIRETLWKQPLLDDTSCRPGEKVSCGRKGACGKAMMLTEGLTLLVSSAVAKALRICSAAGCMKRQETRRERSPSHQPQA